jgi:DNA-directed RNA polymerase specialized sigma24 family protein
MTASHHDSGELTEPAAPSERRGRPRSYLSYWSERRREQRAAVFLARERGLSVRAIAEETGLTVHAVEALLLSDRRTRRP